MGFIIGLLIVIWFSLGQDQTNTEGERIRRELEKEPNKYRL